MNFDLPTLCFMASITETGVLLFVYSLGNFDGYHEVSESGEFYRELGIFQDSLELMEYMDARNLEFSWV